MYQNSLENRAFFGIMKKTDYSRGKTMLYRKVSSEIYQWIEGGQRALLVDGARQVGKTYLIRECLKASGWDFLEINLIEHPEMIRLLSKSSTAHDLNVNLSLFAGRTLTVKKTILFIDEIQEYTDIVTRIKFWVDEGSFRYILSGSLLGVELVNLRSAPVGYLDEIIMYPLDFEEFLMASSVPADVTDELRSCYADRRTVPEFIHQKIMEHFRRYLVIGGMPAAVREYVQSGDMSAVMRIQRNIIAQYKRDFTKYESREKRLMLISVYERIPSELLKQNRRFNLADIKKGLRFDRVEDSFLWMEKAGVAIPVFNATEPRISLNQNEKSSLLKLYLNDIGLLTCLYGKATKTKLLAEAPGLNRGGIYENAVAQELNAHGYRIYYYNSRKRGELDFVIEHNDEVLPIEVKSGKDYYVHSAINAVTENKEYNIPEAFILADCNVERRGKTLYLPVYMCMFISEDIELPMLSPVM